MKSITHIIDGCEWNPNKNDWTLEGEEHAEAKYIVGKDGYRLCDFCAGLQKFKRMKKIKVMYTYTKLVS